jgi:hypothetical protein
MFGVPDRALNAVRQVGNYFGNIAREVRDVPTAMGTGIWSSFERENSRPGYNQREIDNSTRAGWNNRAQVKDVFQAIGGDTGGMRSDQYDKKGNYVSGSSLTPKPSKPSSVGKAPSGTPMPKKNSSSSKGLGGVNM